MHEFLIIVNLTNQFKNILVLIIQLINFSQLNKK
jgi:hypothetical protein